MNLLIYVLLNVVVTTVYSTVGAAFMWGVCDYTLAVAAAVLAVVHCWHLSVPNLEDYNVQLTWRA